MPDQIGSVLAILNHKIKDKCALHNIVRLRKRHIMTRSNKVRFRYVLATILCFGAILTFGVKSSPLGLSLKVASFIDVASISDAENGQLTLAALQSGVSDGMRRAVGAIQIKPIELEKDIKISEGDTVAGVLKEAGLTDLESYKTVKALGRFVDLRTVRPGQELKVKFKPGDGQSLDVEKISMEISPIKEVNIVKTEDAEFVTDIFEKELKDSVHGGSAEIETSLYGSALKAGIPAAVIANMIRTYSWNIDFQRDIRSGDKIEVLYEVQETDDGSYAKYGDILYAKLNVGGREIPIYRFEMSSGRVEYFGPDGTSIKKTLMKTPIDGARISSSFGMRKHPVLGYNKMHKGMDFAAPTGTPIYAAGDGKVTFKGRKGGYGNYIKIRHNGRLDTAYAHMHRFASNITTGSRVKQGQVIGYVGTTGRSTGPHLHYEVLVNNVQKNPNSVDLPTGEELGGKDLTRFKANMAKMDARFNELTNNMKVARKKDDKSDGVYFLQ